MNRTDRWVAAAIGVVVSAIYMLLVTQPFATFDGASLSTSMITCTPAWMDGKPLYVWLGHLLYRLANPLFADRESLLAIFGYFSAVSGGATAAVTYLIARRLVPDSREAALAGVAMLVTAPMYLFTSVTIEVYLPNMLFVSLAVYCWICGYFIAWGLCFGAAMASHGLGVMLTPLFVLDGLTDRPRWIRSGRFYAGAALAVLFPLLAYWWVIAANQGLGPFFRKYWGISRRDYFQGAAGLSARLTNLWRATGPVLALLFLLAPLAAIRWREQRRTVARLLLWVTPYAAFLLYWIQDQFFPAIGGQFYVYLAAPFAVAATLILSLAQSTLARRAAAWRHLVTILVAITAMATALPPTARTLRSLYGPHPYAIFARRVSPVMPKGSLVLCMWESKILQVYRPDLMLDEWFGSRRGPDPAALAGQIARWRARISKGQRIFATIYWLKRASRRFPSQYREILTQFQLAYVRPELGELKLRE